MGADPRMRRGILGERVAYCKVQGISAMQCAEMAEPIDLPFGLWTKEAQVQSFSPGGTNVPTWEGTLVPPGKYD